MYGMYTVLCTVQSISSKSCFSKITKDGFKICQSPYLSSLTFVRILCQESKEPDALVLCLNTLLDFFILWEKNLFSCSEYDYYSGPIYLVPLLVHVHCAAHLPVTLQMNSCLYGNSISDESEQLITRWPWAPVHNFLHVHHAYLNLAQNKIYEFILL